MTMFSAPVNTTTSSGSARNRPSANGVGRGRAAIRSVIRPSGPSAVVAVAASVESGRTSSRKSLNAARPVLPGDNSNAITPRVRRGPFSSWSCIAIPLTQVRRRRPSARIRYVFQSPGFATPFSLVLSG